MVGQPPNHNVHYGIQHAQYCHWSRDIITRAKQIRQQLVTQHDSDATKTSLDKTKCNFKSSLAAVIKRMCAIQNNSSNNKNAIPVMRELLRSFQRN